MRSYLHFSQLSAWYSSSRGQEPKNVLYRITIPGEAFASKFSCKPEEHYFPSASKSQIQTFIDFTVQNSPITCFLSAHGALAVCERLFLWLLFNTLLSSVEFISSIFSLVSICVLECHQHRLVNYSLTTVLHQFANSTTLLARDLLKKFSAFLFCKKKVPI